MEFFEKELLVYRIMCGYLRYGKLRILCPTYEWLYKAQLIYQQAFEKAGKSGAFSDSDIYKLLVDAEQWTEKKEDRLKKIEKDIEDAQVELYQSRLRKKDTENNRWHIRKLRNEFIDLYTIRHSYDTYTCHGVAKYAKTIFLIENLTFYKDSVYSFNSKSRQKVFDFFQSNVISDEQYRELARTEPFNSLWFSRKAGRLFKKELTDEQRNIVKYASLYEAVYKSHEKPPEFVINDNDMFDGWLILKRREADKRTNEEDLTSMLGKAGESQEVYIPCDTIEDAKRIQSLNDTEARVKIASREKALKDKSELSEVELPDVKRRIQMEFNQKGK